MMLLYRQGDQRTFHIIPDEEALCDLVLTLCEADLAKKRGLDPRLAFDTTNPVSGNQRVVQYDAADLLNFLDVHLTDLIVLKFHVEDRRYDPEGRDWLKNRLYQSLVASTAVPATTAA